MVVPLRLHGFAREISVVPNDEPDRGRCKVRAICECGHEESGFGNTRLSAWRRSLARLHDHLDQYVETLSRS